MDSLKKHLKTFNLKDIKSIIKAYNLHTVIKMSQTKENLINELITKIYNYNDNVLTTNRINITTPRKVKADTILKKRILKNKKDDKTFEKEDKLIKELIKEQEKYKKVNKPAIKQEAKKPAIKKDIEISIDAQKEYKKLKDNGFEFYISPEQFGQIYNKKSNQKLLFINNLFRENNSTKDKKKQKSQFQKIIDEMDGNGDARRFRVSGELMDQIDNNYNRYNYFWFADFGEAYENFIDELENSRDFERATKDERDEILEGYEEDRDEFDRDITYYSATFFPSD